MTDATGSGSSARGSYGCLPKTPDARDYRARPAAPYTGGFVDLAGGFPEPPYDQLRLGSCVPNGVAAAIDFARAKQGLPPLKRPSRLFIYWNGRQIGGYGPGEDSGLQIRDGIQAAAKFGAPVEDPDWPYDVAKFAVQPPAQAFTDGALDEAVVFGAVADSEIDAMIASGWPVVFGFDVRESFESDEVAQTGVMPVPRKSEKSLGGHCVVAVSTVKDGADIPDGEPGVKYRKCRNSWGHDGSWGCPDAPGYFWMPVKVMDSQQASDFWQITTVTAPDKPTPPPGAASFPVAPDVATRVAAAASRLNVTGQAWLDKHLRTYFHLH